MRAVRLLRQTCTLIQKDLLLVARRAWFITLARALILPVIITFILGYVKVLIAPQGLTGVQAPAPILSLQDAFRAGTRSEFIIIDHSPRAVDIDAITSNLSQTAIESGLRVQHVSDQSELSVACPTSVRGRTDCFAAVEFWSSPDIAPGAIWNYTLHFDDGVFNDFRANRQLNRAQIYAIPLQHAIDSMITSSHGGPGLPDNIQQFAFTETFGKAATVTTKLQDRLTYVSTVETIIAFVFFVAMCGSTYHLTGHITQQRERGLLKLIDAMMPNADKWECVAARAIASHVAFDIIYAPGWVIMGAITGAYAFSSSSAGPAWYVLLYVLTGLALSSYSILVSSLFKREQLGAITAVMVVIALALIVQFAELPYDNNTTSGVVWALSILFPPCTFLYWMLSAVWLPELVKYWRYVDYNAPNYPWLTSITLRGGSFFACFVFQIVFYTIAGIVVEHCLHGQASRSRYLRDKERMSGNAVRMSGVTKYYETGFWKTNIVRAVEKLDLDLYAGSIAILLGSNGSGKTTTLNAIAGLEPITEGKIEIDASGGVGLCPQTNVHWDVMTVEEHITFFERLKRPYFTGAQSQPEIDRLVAGCDLKLKRSSRAKTLSGGQMRKLQLAMMLAGGSKVCCIDEASSGIDPLARRKIWDILLHERGNRTMLLSTHFLDETEVLSDHVAILSKGRLKAEGSVASLKHRYGGGYHVIVPHPERLDYTGPVPQGAAFRQGSNSGIFEVSDTSMLTPVVSLLNEVGITDYRIRAPTIEDVFLKLAEEMKVGTSDNFASEDLPPVTDLGFSDLGIRLGKGPVLPEMNLQTGLGCGPLRQTWILFLKRVTVLRHNYMPYFWALTAPLLLAGLVIRFFVSTRDSYGYSNPCSFAGTFSNWDGSLALRDYSTYGLFGPANRVNKEVLQKYIPDPTNDYYYSDSGAPTWEDTIFVNSTDKFYQVIRDAVYSSSGYEEYKWGGFYLGDINLFAFGADNPFDAIFTQAMHDMVAANTTFAVGYQSFASSFEPPASSQAIVSIFVALGFTLYPGLFALYPTAERLHNVRAFQYSNGILSSSLWLAHALFDLMFIVIISVFVTVIWATTHHGWYGLAYVFVVVLLYGIAATLYSYLISLWAKSQIAALACTCLLQMVITMLFFVGYVVAINRAAALEVAADLNYVYYFMAPLCPGVSLLRAMLVSLNVYGLACEGLSRASYPGGINYFGGPILYLTVQIVFYTILLVYLETGRSLEVFGIRKRFDTSIVEEIEPVEVEDIFDDEKHLTLSEQGLRLFNLTKTFGPVRAVENVNLGILPSEKFALLGPNGAGKSTIISLVRGMLQPDWTDPPAAVWVSGDSLMDLPVAAKNHLGVCPQFDAVDYMTLSEHLHFYARVRGVPDKDFNIRQLINTLGLKDDANKLAKKLSGGTKRKLSLAIALIANPSVLLLDEPSSGMDPAAKRTLWATLSNISAGRSLLLTTHSMEEAAALCDRAGIMATKMLALGSIADLCAQHGDKVYVHIVHQDAPYTSADDMDRIWLWAKGNFVIAEAEKRNFGGQLRFAVPIRKGPRGKSGLADGSDMGRLFRIIEEAKEEVRIRDYSVGPTTLDQVFLNVVSKHDVVEENWAPEKSRWRSIKRLLKRRGSDLSQWSFATDDD